MTLEVCVDSYEGALLAQNYKAKRIELCSALSVGGLTPSVGLVEQCTSLKNLEVHCMLRHREGDFLYNQREIDLLKRDLSSLAKLPIKGVVLGCLTAGKRIDLQGSKQLLQVAQDEGLEGTFHRAFDFVNDPKQALNELIDLGFNRLLTSGKQSIAQEGIELIRELVELATGRIEIMAGSGVNATNALQLAETGVNALHFTSHQKMEDSNYLGMGFKNLPNEEKIAAISKLFG